MADGLTKLMQGQAFKKYVQLLRMNQRHPVKTSDAGLGDEGVGGSGMSMVKKAAIGLALVASCCLVTAEK